MTNLINLSTQMIDFLAVDVPDRFSFHRLEYFSAKIMVKLHSYFLHSIRFDHSDIGIATLIEMKQKCGLSVTPCFNRKNPWKEVGLLEWFFHRCMEASQRLTVTRNLGIWNEKRNNNLIKSWVHLFHIDWLLEFNPKYRFRWDDFITHQSTSHETSFPHFGIWRNDNKQ